MSLAMMYMFVYCSYSKYMDARFEPKTSWRHTKVLTTKPLQNFINKEKKFSVELFMKFKL
jgi:hypothetical protein